MSRMARNNKLGSEKRPILINKSRKNQTKYLALFLWGLAVVMMPLAAISPVFYLLKLF
ncbi:hypothetical protein Pse7367_1653 [Thalassoporum mexicanum PCC 7367]|nr:hypothetical protein [Pseudanabaena sp. PCC 7367]AFY69941.1 hypothetical protein Pse7367_1653 [Pseudanabaena sp. PCC 7367]